MRIYLDGSSPFTEAGFLRGALNVRMTNEERASEVSYMELKARYASEPYAFFKNQ